MCGRYFLTSPPAKIAEALPFEVAGFEDETSPPHAADPQTRPPGPGDLFGRYNVAPQQPILIVRPAREDDDAKTPAVFDAARWGLVPSWAKDPAVGNRMINARAESAAEKPAFKAAYRRRRCLVPADGFYEWKRREQGPKQPMALRAADAAPLMMAGLFEYRSDADGSTLLSCTILTTKANAETAEIHDRMPLILQPSQTPGWLGLAGDGSADDPPPIPPPPADGTLEAFPVSRRVNDPTRDEPELIRPIETPAQPTQGELFEP